MSNMRSRDFRRVSNSTKKEFYRGGNSKGEWSAQLKFSVQPVKTHFQLPEVLYKDPYNPEYSGGYKRLLRHFLKFMNNGKGGYIECGSEKCVVDAYLNPEKFKLDANIKDKRLVSAHQFSCNYAIAGIMEEWCHLVPRKNPNTGSEYTTREICTGRNCDHCKKLGPRSRVFGKRIYSIFSSGAWEYEILPVVEKAEKSCKCGGNIYVVHYVCPHCGEVLIDLASCPHCEQAGLIPEIGIDVEQQIANCTGCNSTWSLLESEDKSLKEAVDTEVLCSCGKKVFPEAVMVCTNCETPDPMSIYDIQFKICKDKEGKQANTKVKSWEIRELDPRLFDPKFQGAFDGASQDQITAAESAAERMQRPIDLEKIFIIESTSTQASLIGKPDPFANSNIAVRSNYSSSIPDSQEIAEQQETYDDSGAYEPYSAE